MSLKETFRSPMPSFGIVSGAGPEAGATLYRLITRRFQEQGAWRDAHFPLIHTVNFPFAEMLQEPYDPKLVGEQLSVALNHLIDTCGCDYVFIACNTLHLFLPDAVPKELINLITLLKESLPADEEPLVVASETSAKANLHGELLRTEVEYYDPKKSQQYIDAILAGQKPDLSWLERLAYDRPTIPGCTEYSAALMESHAPFIDPLELAAKKALELSLPLLKELLQCEKRAELSKKGKALLNHVLSAPSQ